MPSLRLSGPKGVALAFSQGPVKGGGYLFFDPDQSMYAGAVQLSIKALSLSAVGVVTTRLPDGSDGFSMLVMITAEIPPIQLGFGFSLIGIGGLVGIHRGMEQDVWSPSARRSAGLDRRSRAMWSPTSTPSSTTSARCSRRSATGTCSVRW